MKARWRAWVARCDRREAATTLACFRIAIGLVTLYSLLDVGLGGLVDVLWVDYHSGGYACLGTGNWLMTLLGGATPHVVHALYGVALGSALLVTMGLAGRLSALVAGQTYMALVFVNGSATGGYDMLITNALWLLVLGDATRTLSLDCRLRSGSFVSDASIPAWPRYLAVFQLVVMYTTTGLHKLSTPWLPMGGYSALYDVFQEPTWRRFDMRWTAHVYPLTQLATATTWFFEVGAPLLLVWFYFRHTRERPGRARAWFARRDLRFPFVAIGLVLHLGILVTLNVGPFSWAAMAYYLCLWHPDELAGARAWTMRRAER
ncbi:MAG: HTTM domain-containing protein [Sandaracinaceae bacterium]|nr:HTTM domain-containing protein [Sandaracinaceae bacterium]